MVFRYEGNDHFHLLTFYQSASEIEYPHSSTEDDGDGVDSDPDGTLTLASVDLDPATPGIQSSLIVAGESIQAKNKLNGAFTYVTLLARWATL